MKEAEPVSPQIGDVWRKPRPKGGPPRKMIWQLCMYCAKERWVDMRQWRQGKSRMCHHCYVTKEHNPAICKNFRGAGNPRWKGGRRKRKDGYIAILVPDDYPYPEMVDRHYVLEHRHVMAQALGRAIVLPEIVHHIDGDRTNNALSNLKLTTQADHELRYSGGYEAGFADGVKYAIKHHLTKPQVVLVTT